MNSCVIVTAMYALNIKYYVRGYPWKFFSWSQRVIDFAKNNSLEVKVIIYTDHDTWRVFEDYMVKKRMKPVEEIEVVFIPLKDVPEVPRPGDLCGLKLGWNVGKRKHPGALGDLCQVWCNKLWFINHASTKFPSDNIVWIDCGHRKFEHYLGKHIPRFYSDFAKNTLYSNRYGRDTIGGPRVSLPKKNRAQYAPTRGHINPYMIKHQGCKYPHFIFGASIACSSDSVEHIYDTFITCNNIVAKDSRCFDEETILSYMFIHNSGVEFKRWGELSNDYS